MVEAGIVSIGRYWIITTFPLPYFLSGGIGLDELAEIKKLKLNAYAIDVNSKFELEPGLKDVEMVKKLINYRLED